MSAAAPFTANQLGAFGAVLPSSQWDMLAVLDHHHPVHLTRREMMLAAGFYEHIQGRVGAYACFEFGILRLQDALRPHGWRLDDTAELYRLIKISSEGKAA